MSIYWYNREQNNCEKKEIAVLCSIFKWNSHKVLLYVALSLTHTIKRHTGKLLSTGKVQRDRIWGEGHRSL